MKRIVALDILRGFALMGILYANIPALAHVVLPAARSTDEILFRIDQYGFEQRFFPIFSFLFSVGFSSLCATQNGTHCPHAHSLSAAYWCSLGLGSSINGCNQAKRCSYMASDVITYRQAAVLWLLVCAGQILVSHLWLRRFRYGPLEWVWRWATYGRRPTLSNTPNSSEALA